MQTLTKNHDVDIWCRHKTWCRHMMSETKTWCRHMTNYDVDIRHDVDYIPLELFLDEL